MKKFIITLAALASLSGVALAERPIESSDRVDYMVNASATSQVVLQSQPFAAIDSDEFLDQRRQDEKNEVSN